MKTHGVNLGYFPWEFLMASSFSLMQWGVGDLPITSENAKESSSFHLKKKEEASRKKFCGISTNEYNH